MKARKDEAMKKPIQPIESKALRDKFALSLTHTATTELINALTRGQYSQSSTQAMTSDWNTFLRFCKVNKHKTLPTSELTLLQFIEHQAQEKKYSTIRRCIVNIGRINTFLFNKNPTKYSVVKQTLAKLGSSDEHRPIPIKGITRSDLQRLRNTLKEPTPKNIRDLLVAHIMFDGAMKRSEIINAKTSDVNAIRETILIDGNEYKLQTHTMAIVKLWLPLITDGEHLVRSIDRHENVSTERINESSVHRILKTLKKHLQLPDYEHLSPQSARIGAIQHLHDDGTTIHEIQHFARYKTKAMPLQYIHGSDAAKDAFYELISPNR
ncbi:tyrosine-type recombinase/integrase [Vibrio parahaemolyticus]|nr:tyrosine-type recombinase/integrase [Vibrio parahaemolyticus]